MASIGYSYATLLGRVSGNENKAYNFINSLNPDEAAQRNRDESKLRSKAKKRRVGRMK